MQPKIHQTEIGDFVILDQPDTPFRLLMSLYETIKAEGIEHQSHESDLYLPDTAKVRAILDRFPLKKSNATRFPNQVEGGIWIDVPFAFEPWWIARCGRA